MKSWVLPEIDESEVVMLRLIEDGIVRAPCVVNLPAVDALAMLILIVSPDERVVSPETVWVAVPSANVELLPPVKSPVIALAVLPKFIVPPLEVISPAILPPIVRVELDPKFIAPAKI